MTDQDKAGAVKAEDIARVIAEAMWGPDAASVYFDTSRMDQRGTRTA